MMENDLATPFTTHVLGVEVIVERIDMTHADDLVAVCPSLRRRAPSGSQRIGICGGFA
jgi:hypothetical protein